MNPKELQLMSDNELGIHLAVRYMKMTELLNQLGLDKEMLGFLQEAFGSYMDKYSDGALSDESRAFDAYHYTLKQYESSGDIKKVLEQVKLLAIGLNWHSFQPAWQKETCKE